MNLYGLVFGHTFLSIHQVLQSHYQDFVVLLQAHRRSALLPTNHQLLHSLSQVVYLFVILGENKELLVKFLDFSLKSLQSTLFSLSKVADVDR